MGTALTIRALIGERAIFLREQAVGLSTTAYLLAKVFVFTVFAVIQSAIVTAIAIIGKGWGPGAVETGAVIGNRSLELFVDIAVTTVAAAMVGLALSALARSQEQIMPLLVVAIMSQLVFSGGAREMAPSPGVQTAVNHVELRAHSVGSVRAPRRSASSSLRSCARTPRKSAPRSTAFRRSAPTRRSSSPAIGCSPMPTVLSTSSSTSARPPHQGHQQVRRLHGRATQTVLPARLQEPTRCGSGSTKPCRAPNVWHSDLKLRSGPLPASAARRARRGEACDRRCPAGRCSFDGAATRQSIPGLVNARANAIPVGPAS